MCTLSIQVIVLLLKVHHVPVSRSMMHINDDAAVDVCRERKVPACKK
jgi:hypothetical protein